MTSLASSARSAPRSSRWTTTPRSCPGTARKPRWRSPSAGSTRGSRPAPKGSSTSPRTRDAAMEQLGFEGMPRRLYPCTPSRLRAWLDCPRRYRMAYLDRPPPPKGPPWAHNSLGASVHNALAGWWRLKRAERTPQAAAELLDSGWITEGFADGAQAAEYLRRSKGLVERYVARLDPAREPLGVERTVGARTEQIVLSGRVDRLDDRPVSPAAAEPPPGPDDRELVVVDYKTGRGRLSANDARSSLALA